jgi:cytosine/adenosine deaminase-related metal-dependent hydrolase
MRYLRPSSVLLDHQSLLREAVLQVKDGRVQAVLQASEVRNQGLIEDFPGELWTAAPVLLHAHLESFDAPSSDWPRHSFAAWVQALLAWRNLKGSVAVARTSTDSAASPVAFGDRMAPQASARASWRELRRYGCGTVLTQRSEAGAQVVDPQCLVLQELFAPDEASAPALLEGLQQQKWGSQGIALHAPYSVSEPLARGAFEWVEQHPCRVLSIHLGEHQEERAYMAEQKGPLAELLAQNQRACKTQMWPSSVDWLEEVAPGVRPNLLVVHAADLREHELHQLQRKQAQLVWCPGTHLYFDRARPRFFDAGLPAPALGCDSRASNAVLDPLREVRLARQILPEYGPTQWWRSLTEGGAKALPQTCSEGSLQPGKLAKPLRFTDPGLHDPTELCDYLTATLDLHPLCEPGLPPTKG